MRISVICSTLFISVRAFQTNTFLRHTHRYNYSYYCAGGGSVSESIRARTTTAFRRSMTSTDDSAASSTKTTTTTTTSDATSSSTSSIVATSSSSVNISGPALPPIPSSAKRLFLVRHGEVVNPGGTRPVYYGAQDVPLSPLGKQEAMAAAQYLSQFVPVLQHIACSPLQRAIYGAERVQEFQLQQQQQQIMNQKRKDNDDGDDNDETTPSSSSSLLPLSSDLMIVSGFMELDRGAWCGKTKEEIGSDLMERFDACDDSVTPEGGESYRTLKARVLNARDHVLEQTRPGYASAIVSHLQVTRCILSDAMGLPMQKMASLKIATASITCIDYDIESKTQTVHYQSFKPNVGLETAKDGAN